LAAAEISAATEEPTAANPVDKLAAFLLSNAHLEEA